MMRGMSAPAILAGFFYALLLFALGFLLGPIREFLLTPWFGPVAAVAIEVVPMVAAMAWLAPRIARGMEIPPRVPGRVVMGLVALLLVLAAEIALSRLLRGLGPAGTLARYGTPQGMVGAALLGIFAAMPWLRR